MSYSLPRLMLFAIVALPVAFILTALVFAVSGQPINAARIFPWAAGIATIAGVAGGFTRIPD